MRVLRIRGHSEAVQPLSGGFLYADEPRGAADLAAFRARAALDREARAHGAYRRRRFRQPARRLVESGAELLHFSFVAPDHSRAAGTARADGRARAAVR